MESPLAAKAALLQALATPDCGTGLARRIREATTGRIRLRPGSVYPALRALERAGLVRRMEDRRGRTGRPRRYYELTIEGAAAAMAQREALSALFGAAGRPSPPDAALMRDRIRSCAKVSAFVHELRVSALSARRP